MKVFADVLPGATTSRAMGRVTGALKRFAPHGIEFVGVGGEPDLQILHVIGPIRNEHIIAPKFAMVQYCYKSAGGQDWAALWSKALAIWSYYDLPAGPRFYYAPLGVDPTVFYMRANNDRPIGIVTSGYVSAPSAEAIEEVAEAANQLGLTVMHIGPQRIEGMVRRKEKTWGNCENITEGELRSIYQSAKLVSGLRHVEGFELPVIEGLACGARSIVFERPEMRHWYGANAIYVPESHGEELIERLIMVMARQPSMVSMKEKNEFVKRFDWNLIVSGFWAQVLS